MTIPNTSDNPAPLRLPTLGRLGAGLSLALFVTWTLLLIRTSPLPVGDYGTYTTVAERLIAGDRLYLDVWDNKEPIFFYLLAVGRLISPLSGWFLEFTWFVTAGIAVYTLCLRLRMSVRRSAVVAGIGVPLIMSGAPYEAGSSHIPGIAIALVSMAFLAGRRFLLAGICLGILPLLKILVFPVAAIMIGVLLTFGWSWRRTILTLLGFLLACVASAAIVIVRGEWAGFVILFTYNGSYPSQVVGGTSFLDVTVGHLRSVLEPPALIAAVVAVALASFALYRRSRGNLREVSALAWASLAGLLGSMAVFAATGLWFHHSMLLTIPAVTALVSWAASLRPGDTTLLLIAVVGVSFVLAGIPSPQRVLHKVEYARGDLWLQLTPPSIPLEEGTTTQKTIARVGGGDEVGIGRLLRDWDLACPNFHQHPWDDEAWLDETLKCLPSAHVIYVSRREFAPVEGLPEWNAYVANVNSLLEREYVCRELEGSQLCLRKD